MDGIKCVQKDFVFYSEFDWDVVEGGSSGNDTSSSKGRAEMVNVVWMEICRPM